MKSNIERSEFDRLKAILTNCVPTGPALQNRDAPPDFRAYLSGRIAYMAMLNRPRGLRLWVIFDRITWESE